MDSDETAYRWHLAACPLGVLNAEILLYSFSCYQNNEASAAYYLEGARRNMLRFPLRVLLGSRWPLFSILASDKLREVGPGHLNLDEPLHCEDIADPLLNWQGFLGNFAETGKSRWYENSIKYVFSWQMIKIPQRLEEECFFGYLTAMLIKAFTCMTSESTCYKPHARRLERWLREDPDSVAVLAHSRWPLALVLHQMAKATRHRYQLDFAESELAGPAELFAVPSSLWHLGPWAGGMANGHTRSFRDAVGVLPHLGLGAPEAPNLVYITMVYGERFNKYISRFSARARALGVPGRRLIFFTLDEEAYHLCLRENEHRCIRGTPSIVNKFTLPLVLARLGLDSVWIDLDVFLMQDPTPVIAAHARRGPPYEILISGSFEADCICNGIVYFAATDAVRTWLLSVVIWMYNHPYEHDQKTFSAFLDYTETVQAEKVPLPQIPPWDTLDPITQFVTPDTFEGNGWMGELEDIVMFHFLNGESDTGSDLDPSGTWLRDHGHFEETMGPPPCRTDSDSESCKVEKVSLMDLFYGQSDEELYTTPKAPYENPAIRRALLASRKTERRTHLLGKPCGPLVGVLG